MLPANLSQDAFSSLCDALAAEAGQIDASGDWPTSQLRRVAEAGVFRWFASQNLGGEGWSEPDLLQAYLALAKSCLTTAFILTQRQGAMGRIKAVVRQDFA